MMATVAYESRTKLKGASCKPFDTQGKRDARAQAACLRKGRIATDSQAARAIGPELRRRERESFFVLAINRDGKVLSYEEVARGQRHRVQIAPQDVLKVAVRHDADAFVMAHNHPTSSPSPSPKDRQLTARVKKAAQAVGVVFLDHLIFSKDGRYYSFADKKTKRG